MCSGKSTEVVAFIVAQGCDSSKEFGLSANSAPPIVYGPVYFISSSSSKEADPGFLERGVILKTVKPV